MSTKLTVSMASTPLIWNESKRKTADSVARILARKWLDRDAHGLAKSLPQMLKDKMNENSILETNSPDWKALAEQLAKERIPFTIRGFDFRNENHVDFYGSLRKHCREGEYEGRFDDSKLVAIFGEHASARPG